jgi:flavin reductase (DIM6/NTAB) family NADH-FMN oxidoreductase RutF
MSRQPDPATFRGAASRFPTGVTVVTSVGAEGAAVGMTANSFTTVSTKPPTVLVSLTRGRTWQAVRDSGIYTVNVMPSDAVAICRHFGGRPLNTDVPQLTQSDGFPILPGAIAHFACQVVQSIDVADHTLFIGAVRWCRQQDGTPLAFYGSRFCHGLGSEIAS